MLTELEPLAVHENEFQLGNFSVKQGSDQPVVKSPDLHEFWKGFVEFPLHYFVRMEEMVFWKVI
ncbi:hypothetical protein GN244_ATG14926 [Phytophthora infestans]|uniref:Uncharacterized protein n=1 Tax=Phytophthora infestans TaxID=4787 RepID=A0A833VXV8_PHYIN|nr:hypothetical protein GN244_ATG14926 [Phytophthora infestans]KAF4128748.1 hypothetical protein GN958_ATG22054 [Phytophthora infestans]